MKEGLGAGLGLRGTGGWVGRWSQKWGRTGISRTNLH